MPGSGTEPGERRMDSLDGNSVIIPQRMTSDTVFSSLSIIQDNNCIENYSMKEDAI